MSGRKLGGGRILGSGKGLAPPQASPSPRAASPFPPRSESTVSIGSSSVSVPATGGSSSLTDLGQGLGDMISVGAQNKGPGADSSMLVCPICNEEMVTLLQLNRHIDDNHQELPEEEQDEVKTWFDKQVSKAKRFQPLSLIHQKLRGLDVFESNESTPVAPPPHHHHQHSASTASVAAASSSKAPAEAPADPDELITRKHWQRTTSDDYCTDPTCRKSLGPIAGSINCRHCGKLFCEEHTMYQMKLSRSAQHEPVRGYWARVCETCYKSREGYNDHNGHVVDHTSAFTEIRRKRVERNTLEVSRLEKRLTKLTRLLANPPEKLLASSNTGSLLNPMSAQKNQRKMLEQTVVTWEDDNEVARCPFCQQEFGSWTFRRHHCRICGKVVCADPQTGCSSEVGLNVNNEQTNHNTEKPPSSTSPDQLSVDIRMCRDCSHTVFASREFASSLQHKPPDQRAYETLRQFQRGIIQLLPSFHRALLALQPEKSDAPGGGVDLSRPPPTHAQIQEAAKMRKRLVDAFAKYGAAAKRIRDLPAEGAGQKRLQMAVYTYASGFLHTNMLPLKSLPQLLRSSSSSSSRTSRLLASSQHSSNGSTHLLHPSNLRHAEFASDSDSSAKAPRHLNGNGNGNGNGHHPPPSDTDDGASTVVSQLETEEKELRERLVILEEQLFMVEQMTQVATKRRRFEEVSALSRNREELEGEIATLRGKVGDVEVRWEGVYQNGTA